MKNSESGDKTGQPKSIWDPDHELSPHITKIQVNGNSYKRIDGNLLADWDSKDREEGLGYAIFYGSDPAKFVPDPYEPKKRGRKRFK